MIIFRWVIRAIILWDRDRTFWHFKAQELRKALEAEIDFMYEEPTP